MKPLQIVLLMSLALLLTGCGKGDPDLTPVSGVVTKNGEPVNRAQVRFVPIDGELSEFIGAGITDDDGKFTIKIAGREGDLCCTGQCKVTIREAGIPAEIRGRLEGSGGGQGGGALQQYKKSLKNRPIPKDYERLHSTPLLLEVTTEQQEYNIEL